MSLIDAAVNYVYSLFRDNAGGHDAAHTLRVYQNAMLIAQQEPDCDLEILALSALLHDADDHKLFHTENNANARYFLTQHDVETDKTERICKAINAVSFSQNRGKRPDSLEGMIVQDADRLDAIDVGHLHVDDDHAIILSFFMTALHFVDGFSAAMGDIRVKPKRG